MDNGRWTMDNGRWSMVDGQWTMDNGRWTMVDGQWTMGNGRWAMDNGRWTMDDGQWTMVDGQWTMGNGRWTMVDGQWTMDDGNNYLFYKIYLHQTKTHYTMKVLYSIIALAGLLVMETTVQAQVTKIFIVRHADRDGNLDALKSPQGTKRAQELKRIFLNTGIDRIYSPNTNRTRATAEPLANALDITTALYSNSRQVIDTILNRHRGKEILVVGHSNTVDTLIKRCGCPGIGMIPDTQFDNLYLVIVERTTKPVLIRKRCHLLKMKYGAVTP